MKIAILNSSIFPIPAVRGGAVETLIESFVKEAQHDPSVELTVFSLADNEAERRAAEFFPRTRFVWLERPAFVDSCDRAVTTAMRALRRDPNLWQKNHLWQLMVRQKLRRALLVENFDVILIENAIFLPALFQDRRLREKYRGRVIFHTHNLHYRTVTPSDAFAGIISISNFLIENTRRCFGAHLPIEIVPNGVDTARFTREVPPDELTRLRADFNIPADAPLLCFVGRIMPKKGVKMLLDAFDELAHSEAHLMLVGASSFGMTARTPFEEDIFTRAVHHPRIHTTGFVPHDELRRYYAAADAVVLPSLWEEALGLTMIEAQLAGRPLITTNRGGIPETTSPDTSVLVDVTPHFVSELAKAIDAVLDDAEIWEQRAVLARQQAEERFNEQRYYASMLHVIRQLTEVHTP